MDWNMEKIIKNPQTGTVLSVSAGFMFYVLCMMFPLIGPSGARVDNAKENQAAFLSVLVLSLLLSAASAYVSFKRRQLDEESRIARFPLVLSGVCLFIFVTLLLGGFAI